MLFNGDEDNGTTDQSEFEYCNPVDPPIYAKDGTNFYSIVILRNMTINIGDSN